MRRRRRLPTDDEADVPMSPLIDCVFLLLIFFLVTTMLKRKESLIPIKLPDQTSAVAEKAEDETLILGLTTDGQVLKALDKRGRDGELQYAVVEDLAAHLKSLIDNEGPAVLQRPLRIDADRETPFQTAINTLDICKLQGFVDVGIKTRGAKR